MADIQHGAPASACVDSATLAAFVDGKLEGAEGARVVAHIATCPDCAELVGEVVAVDEELDAEAHKSKVVPYPEPPAKKAFWNSRRGMAAVGGFAALAASVVLLLNRTPPIAALVSIVGDQRLILARPTGDFRYGPLRSPMRGPREGASLALQAEAARLALRATETGKAEDLQAAGVAQLLEGSVADGVTALESAARARPEDAAVQADLGAAYMTRFLEAGNQVDGDAALTAFDRALAIDRQLREAWFNKAVLLDRLERPADALAAWSSYLALPTEPGWHEEAVRQRDALQQRAR